MKALLVDEVVGSFLADADATEVMMAIDVMGGATFRLELRQEVS